MEKTQPLLQDTLGFAIPYGNSEHTLSESFFGGGSNDNRARRCRD